MGKANKWARLLGYVTGLVNQELLLQNEYLATENRILRSHLPSRLRLSDVERETLADIGSGWDAGLWPRWPVSRSRIRFCVGIKN